MASIFNILNNNKISQYIDLNVDNKIHSVINLTHNDLDLNDEEIINIEAGKIRIFDTFKENSDELDLFIGFKEDYIKEKFNDDGEKYYKNFIEKKLLQRYSGTTEETKDNYSLVNFFTNNNDKHNYLDFTRQLTDNEKSDLEKRIKYQKHLKRWLTYYLSNHELKGTHNIIMCYYYKTKKYMLVIQMILFLD